MLEKYFTRACHFMVVKQLTKDLTPLLIRRFNEIEKTNPKIQINKKWAVTITAILLLLGSSLVFAFDSTDAEEEGYWYSRYNLGNLVIRSGMGSVVMPAQELIMKAIAMINTDFNKAGLQISAPPLKIAKSPFEYKDEPETFFRYGPSQPVPPMAGGEFGVAPVFATSVGLSHGKLGNF